MKLVKRLTVCVVSGAVFLGMSAPTIVAQSTSSIPVQASMNPAHQTQKGSTGTFVTELSWGGGTFNTYSVSYYDGNTTIFKDPNANYYSKTVSSSYNKGPLSTKTWNTNLRVSNGSSDTAHGTITLKD